MIDLVHIGGFNLAIQQVTPHLDDAAVAIGRLAQDAGNGQLRSAAVGHLDLARSEVRTALESWTTEQAWTAARQLNRDIGAIRRQLAPGDDAVSGAQQLESLQKRVTHLGHWTIPHEIKELAAIDAPGTIVGSSTRGGPFTPFEATSLREAGIQGDADLAYADAILNEAFAVEKATGHIIDLPEELVGGGPLRVPSAERPTFDADRLLGMHGEVPFQDAGKVVWEFPQGLAGGRTINSSGTILSKGNQPVGTTEPARGERIAVMHHATSRGHLEIDLNVAATAHFADFGPAAQYAQGSAAELRNYTRLITPRATGGYDVIAATISPASAKLDGEALDPKAYLALRDELGREAQVPAGIEETSRRLDFLSGHSSAGGRFRRTFQDADPTLQRTSTWDLEYDLPTQGTVVGSVTLGRRLQRDTTHELRADTVELWVGSLDEVRELARKRVGMNVVIPAGHDTHAVLSLTGSDDTMKLLWRSSKEGLDGARISFDDERIAQFSVKRDQYASGRAIQVSNHESLLDIELNMPTAETSQFDRELRELLGHGDDGGRLV